MLSAAAMFFRLHLVVRVVVLGASLAALWALLTHAAPQLSWQYPSIIAALILLGHYRAFFNFRFSFGLSFSSGELLRGRGSSENSDFVASNLLADSDEAYWALAIASIFRGSLLAGAFALPIGWGWQLLIGLGLLKLTSGLRQTVATIERQVEQQERDQFADAALKATMQGRRFGRYVVYLRPFHLTAQLRAYDSAKLATASKGKHPTHFNAEDRDGWQTSHPLITGRLELTGDERDQNEINPDFESALERGVRPLGRLVALGRPGETLGSGRALTDEAEWRDAVKSLGRDAHGFIIIPSDNPGTRWELEWLKAKRNFRNCLFIMPGNQPAFDGAGYWSRAAAALNGLLALPMFMSVPAIFCYDANGIPHLAPIANRAFANAGRTVHFISAQIISRAIARLDPISAGRVDPSMETMICDARRMAATLWEREDAKRDTAERFGLGEMGTAAGPDGPALSARPRAVWWLDARENGGTIVEFDLTAPFDHVSVCSILRPRQGGFEVEGAFTVLKGDYFT